MDLPQLDGVTHRTVAGPRAALPRRRGGGRRPDRARARLAAALVDVAPRRAAARAARPPGDDRPARLRLVRRAARRLRQADAGRRPARRARRARARARVPRRPTTGAPGAASWPAWPRPSASRRFLALGAPRPRRPAERRASCCEVWRFGYQVGDRRAAARPAAGRRRALLDARDHGERRAPPGVDARRPAGVHARCWPSRRARGPACASTGRSSLREVGAHPARAPARADADHDRRRRPAIPSVPARRRRARRRRSAPSRSCPIAGISCPRSARSSSPSAREPCSGSVDPEPVALYMRPSGCSRAADEADDEGCGAPGVATTPMTSSFPAYLVCSLLAIAMLPAAAQADRPAQVPVPASDALTTTRARPRRRPLGRRPLRRPGHRDLGAHGRRASTRARQWMSYDIHNPATYTPVLDHATTSTSTGTGPSCARSSSTSSATSPATSTSTTRTT